MDKRSKQYTEIKKVSKVEKEKRSETSDQRLLKNTRFFKVLSTGLMLGMAGIVEATSTESSSQVKELVNCTQYSSNRLPERYVPTDRDRIAHQQLLDKLNHPPFYFDPLKDAQATSSRETSQAAMETQRH